MLEYSLMKLYPDIFCFSTTRHGGYSDGAYSSFNCNDYCGDDTENVGKNRTLLCSLMPQMPNNLIIPHQTHNTVVRKIDDAFLAKGITERKEVLEGVDALITDRKGECLCISTADCVPVLCYDRRRKAIAAIHAGWKGTVAHIVSKTLKAMAAEYGTRGEDITACIGPSISLSAFEVGDEVYDKFRNEGFDMEQIAVRQDKWHIDLWKANRIQLEDFGVKPENIQTAGICTWTHNQDFFSARRQGIASGRILSGIMLLI